MTRHANLSLLAISLFLFSSFALGAQKELAGGQDESLDGGPSSPPIACTLTSKEKRARIENAETDLLGDTTRIEELENGYTLWFPVEPGRLQRLAELVELESQCCAFLDFEIRLEAGSNEVALSLTGPEGTKEVLGPLMND